MLEKLLLTGAAGDVGGALRPLVKGLARRVVLSDLHDIADLAPHEVSQPCDLADAAAMNALLEGVDGVIHMGGASVERPFDTILQGNIVGLYNLFEAARRNGSPRIVYASSNHVVGYYRREEYIDNRVPPRPDSLYGVSKAFGENLASYYHDRFGQECLSVRIGSCKAQPEESRHLATWLGHDDLAALCGRAFAVPRLGHAIVYGASANDESWWDNSRASYLGWKPVQNAADWRAEIEGINAAAPDDPATMYHGAAMYDDPSHREG